MVIYVTIEVLIGVQSVGICGSDIHFWVDGRIGDRTIVAPTILGHEASGVVIAIGESVTNLQPGLCVCLILNGLKLKSNCCIYF